MNKYIAVYSGGLDSTVMLAHLLNEGHPIKALSIDYGQRHGRELGAVVNICKEMKITHRLIDLSPLKILMAGSSQTDDTVPVPYGHYEEESMKKTVVPNRNMLLLAIAGAWAISEKADGIAYAAHAGDHAIYPDCRPEFIHTMTKALRLADWHKIFVCAPFINMNKADIVRLGHDLCVPFGMTWSCYEGGEIHCGKCGTCVERKEAFVKANVPDPTKYAS